METSPFPPPPPPKKKTQEKKKKNSWGSLGLQKSKPEITLYTAIPEKRNLIQQCIYLCYKKSNLHIVSSDNVQTQHDLLHSTS